MNEVRSDLLSVWRDFWQLRKLFDGRSIYIIEMSLGEPLYNELNWEFALELKSILRGESGTSK